MGIYAIVLGVLVVGLFALARTAKMRLYLLGVLLFGVLLCLMLEYLSGSIQRPIAVVTVRTLGNAAVYLLIATAIVHPWRRRKDGTAPAYVACSVAIALLGAFQLYEIKTPDGSASETLWRWFESGLR
jgi:hypothetical protein